MIVLDLQSEQFPQFARLDQYFGQPYIWCMLHNFGGTLGMHGSAYVINTVSDIDSGVFAVRINRPWPLQPFQLSSLLVCHENNFLFS